MNVKEIWFNVEFITILVYTLYAIDATIIQKHAYNVRRAGFELCFAFALVLKNKTKPFRHVFQNVEQKIETLINSNHNSYMVIWWCLLAQLFPLVGLLVQVFMNHLAPKTSKYLDYSLVMQFCLWVGYLAFLDNHYNMLARPPVSERLQFVVDLKSLESLNASLLSGLKKAPPMIAQSKVQIETAVELP